AVARGDSSRDPARVGRVLQLAPRVGALAYRRIVQGAISVPPHFEDLPADVREYRHRDRQRTGDAIGALGWTDGSLLPRPVRGAADAGTDPARGLASGDARTRDARGRTARVLRVGVARAPV